MPPPTIRDKLRNRWIRKTNGKRSTSSTSTDYTNPLVQALAIQNAPPSSPSPYPLPQLPPPISSALTDSSTQSTTEDGAPTSDAPLLSPTSNNSTPHTISGNVFFLSFRSPFRASITFFSISSQTPLSHSHSRIPPSAFYLTSLS